MKIKAIAYIALFSLGTPWLSCLDLSAGAKVGAAANLFAGSYPDALEASLFDQGAGDVARQMYISYRASFLARVAVYQFISLMAEIGFGPAGGTMLASNGLDMLVGVSGNQLDLVLLAVAAHKMKRLSISLQAGPGVSVSLGTPVVVRNDGFIRSEAGLAATSDLRPALELVGGVGVSFPLGPGFLLIDARYIWGVTSVFFAGATSDSRLMLSRIEITTGYELPVKRNRMKANT